MSQPVQSVVRALDLLRAIAAARQPVSLAELAAATELPKSTTRRLLATLESADMVGRGTHGHYTTGPGLAALGAPTGGVNVGSVAAPFLRDVVELLGEDAPLAVMEDDSLVYLAQVPGPNPIQVPDGAGLRFAPHDVSSGLALMAEWSDDVISEYCTKQMLSADTTNDVHAKVTAGRTRVYVWHIDRWVDGVSAVAAPIRNPTGAHLAAIGAFGPSYRFPGTRDRAQLGDALVQIADRCSRLLR
ncbi:MAG: IclR family transcriptional regulator [Acidimicrobiia bacterium]|nr:IclR family transcriptional regulator [Acidimicrobiia bacterium]